MLYVVGLGPGAESLMTQEALQIIEKVPTIVTYATYAKLISELIKDKNLVVTGMHGEIERCKKAIEIAASGEDVAIVSSGDAGIYGMAGLVLELANKTLPYFRQGLDMDSAHHVCKIIKNYTTFDAVGLTDQVNVLAHVGAGSDHHIAGEPILTDLSKSVITTGHLQP